MSENIELELHKQFKAAQEKYIYFLLAIAASAIGYAITQAKIEPFNLNHAAFGLSVILWSLSFTSGLKFIEFTTNSTFKNVIYLSLKRELKKSPNYAKLISELKNELHDQNEKTIKKLEFYGGIQSKLLLLGALSYMLWHALMMLSVSS